MNAMAEAGRGAVRGVRSDEMENSDEARFGESSMPRQRRPEGWQCVEGAAERSLGRQIFTRNTLPHRRPPKHFLTIGKLGSCPNEGER